MAGIRQALHAKSETKTIHLIMEMNSFALKGTNSNVDCVSDPKMKPLWFQIVFLAYRCSLSKMLILFWTLQSATIAYLGMGGRPAGRSGHVHAQNGVKPTKTPSDEGSIAVLSSMQKPENWRARRRKLAAYKNFHRAVNRPIVSYLMPQA